MNTTTNTAAPHRPIVAEAVNCEDGSHVGLWLYAGDDDETLATANVGRVLADDELRWLASTAALFALTAERAVNHALALEALQSALALHGRLDPVAP